MASQGNVRTNPWPVCEILNSAPNPKFRDPKDVVDPCYSSISFCVAINMYLYWFHYTMATREMPAVSLCQRAQRAQQCLLGKASIMEGNNAKQKQSVSFAATIKLIRVYQLGDDPCSEIININTARFPGRGHFKNVVAGTRGVSLRYDASSYHTPEPF